MPAPVQRLLLLAILAASPALAQPAGWTQLGGPEGGTVSEIAPGADGRVWAITKNAGLFRSDDDAAVWHRVERGPVTGHQGSGLDLDPSWVRGEILAIAASPTDPDVAFASTRQTVLKTEDGGDTWEPTGLSRDVEVIAIAPGAPEVVYLSDRTFVWRSDNGGDTWRQVSRGLAGQGYIHSLTIAPSDPFTVYAALGQGFFRSLDGGRTWVRGQGLDFVEMARVVIDPDNPAILYGLEAYDGLWKSVDQGLTWTRLATFPGGPNLTDLEFDPSSPGTLYLTLMGGIPSAGRPAGRVLRSLDRGVTWTPVLTTELIHDLDFDPETPGRAYLATDVLGVFRSDDSGTTWTPASEGLTATFLSRLTVDPHDPDNLYALVNALRQDLSELGSLGVWKSTDGGLSWVPVNAGLEGLGGSSGLLPAVREVVADPQRAGVIYAATSAGLFKSVDGGGAWQRIDESSPLQAGAWDLTIDPRDSDVLYAVANGGVATAAVAKSTDGGETWTILPGPVGSFQVVELDFWDPSIVYAAGAGFWRSEDEGASWTQVPSAPSGWQRLASGTAPGSLYGLSTYSLFGSGDRGATWSPAGLPVDNLFQIFGFDLTRGPLPTSPLVLATNFGVFRLSPGSSEWVRIGGEFSALAIAVGPLRAYAGTRDGVVLSSLVSGALGDLRRKRELKQ